MSSAEKSLLKSCSINQILALLSLALSVAAYDKSWSMQLMLWPAIGIVYWFKYGGIVMLILRLLKSIIDCAVAVFISGVGKTIRFKVSMNWLVEAACWSCVIQLEIGRELKLGWLSKKYQLANSCCVWISFIIFKLYMRWHQMIEFGIDLASLAFCLTIAVYLLVVAWHVVLLIKVFCIL